MVGAATDTRTIYTAPAGGLTPLTGQNLVPFNAAYATANPTNFAAAHVSTLNQWASISALHTGTKLINYLRGQNGEEDRVGNAERLYRVREATMGDALESQPFYIANPVFSYPYAGYSGYSSAKASRAGTVYMGTNDGMLHAFVATTNAALSPPEVGGVERWAYVPSMVIPNMFHLASSDYATHHVNYVNGSPIISDVCTATNCATATASDWKTILVGGLNGGGRGYYALDITNPATPVLLWEFTTASDSDVGYSYGRPVIARKSNGTWVVLVTSGYNNTSPGTGVGFLYVLNASTGAIISKISTGVGDTTTPSGLAQIAAWNDDPIGNQAGFVYGGDLLGNLWRFNINDTGTAATIGTGSFLKFATLFSDNGGTLPQPITTTPILGKVSTKPVIFVGTGKYLETADLTTTQTQSLYAIKDDGATTTLVNPRAHTATTPKMVQQTITQTSGSGIRTGSTNTVDLLSDLGWFLDFPDGVSGGGSGAERVNISGELVLGTLIIPTIVPSNSVCSPGGYGWLNFFDYKNGNPVTNSSSSTNVSVKYNSTIVGINVIFIGGKAITEVVTSDNPTPTKDTRVTISGPPGVYSGKRVIWRELTPP
jgi:type IV pilus assembly protein PilY1